MQPATKTYVFLPALLQVLSSFHLPGCCLSPRSPAVSFPWSPVLLTNSPRSSFGIQSPSSPSFLLHSTQETRKIILNQKSTFFYTGRSSITSFSGFPLSTGKYSHPSAHWIALRTFYDLPSPYLPSFIYFPLSLPI